jgi:hypothetical protein
MILHETRDWLGAAIIAAVALLFARKVKPGASAGAH